MKDQGRNQILFNAGEFNQERTLSGSAHPVCTQIMNLTPKYDCKTWAKHEYKKQLISNNIELK